MVTDDFSDSKASIHPILSVMRTYAFAYTANHDFSVCPSIMVDEYELRMGRHRIVGRDTDYKKAVQRQFDQFPGLGFTVHDVIANGDRVALRFSEHGRSIFSGVACVWGGLSLYRWDGQRLTSCLVEQDYFTRRRQMERRESNPLESPAIDPWSADIASPSSDSEGTVRDWVLGGGIDESSIGTLDDEWSASPQRFPLEVHETVFDDIFSAGNRVAFHVTQFGKLVGHGLDSGFPADRTFTRHAAGIAVVDGGRVSARIITDRREIERQIEESRGSQSST